MFLIELYKFNLIPFIHSFILYIKNKFYKYVVNKKSILTYVLINMKEMFILGAYVTFLSCTDQFDEFLWFFTGCGKLPSAGVIVQWNTSTRLTNGERDQSIFRNPNA